MIRDEIDPSAGLDMHLHEVLFSVPKGVEVYEINGPSFFGIATRFEELMAQIVRVHFPDLDDKLLTQVLEAFYKIRQLPQIKKMPSTCVIFFWLQALVHGGVVPRRVVKEVPYLGVLLKKNEDMDALRRNWR